MARPTKRPTPDDDDEGGNPLRNHSPTRRMSYIASDISTSPQPGISYSSDKENQTASTRNAQQKSKPTSMTKLPTPTSVDEGAPGSNKRRRLTERDARLDPSQAALRANLSLVDDRRFYDPDQPMEERRAVRKGIRDLARDLADSRNEYLVTDSTGLLDTLTKANDLFQDVKQTSDATLDSRLLVAAGDLSARRSAQMKLGGPARGIDVDEFVNKCVSFMRRGPGDGREDIEGAASTQTRRRRRNNNDSDYDSAAEDSGDEGDAPSWEWLGRKACFPSNIRPPVPAFLLGPLSVQKRIRKQVQRRERLRKRDPADAVRPEELKADEIEKTENSNLTTLCRMILELLSRTQLEGKQAVEAELAACEENMSDAEAQALLEKHNVADDEGCSLYRFAFNPKSFGQTVENLFYICFLIRDGRAGIGQDSRGLTTIHRTDPSSPDDIKARGIIKKQGVFHLDFETWEQIIAGFDIQACVIPHRSDDEMHTNARGWYG